MKPHTTVIVLAATGALVGVAVWSASSEKSGPASGGDNLVLPGLTEKAPSVTSLTVKRAKNAFTLNKDAAGIWRMKEMADYPAKSDAVSQVILGLSQLTEWEVKTSLPAMYSKIGVEDPGTGDAAPENPDAPPPGGVSQPTLLTLKDSSGAVVADIIVGNRKWGQSQSQYGTYVRRNGEAQSWLARGQFDVPSEQIQWLDAQFSNIERGRVKIATVTHPGAEPMVISRENEKASFTLRNLPAGRELKDPGVPESIATVLAFCSFQDVVKASPEFGAADDVKPGPTVEVRTFDGLIVGVNALVKSGKQWWSLTASVDESLITANAAGAPDAEKAKSEADKIRKEVESLNAKWTGWVFAPVDFKSRALNNTLNDLLQPQAAPAAEAPPSVPPSPQPQPPNP